MEGRQRKCTATSIATRAGNEQSAQIDWEHGPVTANDRVLMARFLTAAKSALEPVGCQLTLHSGGYHASGARQLNHVQTSYFPALDLVTDGTLYRGKNLSDWEESLQASLAVVPADRLAPGFCSNGCGHMPWSRSRQSLDERFALLRQAAFRNVTHIALFRIDPKVGWPQLWYWPYLAAWKAKTDDAKTVGWAKADDAKTVGWFVGGNSKTSGINDRGAFLRSAFTTIWNQTGVHLGDRLMPIGCQT